MVQRVLALVVAVVLAAMFATGCGGGEVRDEVATIPPPPTRVPPPPTSTTVPDLADADAVEPDEDPTTVPTATVEPTPTARRTPPPTPTATPIALPAPGATEIQPIPTASPTGTPAPTATPRPSATAVRPIPTAVAPTATRVPPTPTRVPATPVPRPPATPTPRTTASGIPVIEVGCDVSKRSVQVGEILTLSASQSPAGPPVRYAFDHGDGTVDRRAVSQAYYQRPGTYAVTLFWEIGGSRGSIACGTVSVQAAAAAPAPAPLTTNDFIGLSESGAVQLAAQRGYSMVRVARRDSTVYPPRAGTRADRVNIEVDGGVVTSASVG